MAKVLKTATMKRSELKSNHLKIITEESFKSYKKAAKFLQLYEKEQKNYYNKIHFTNINST